MLCFDLIIEQFTTYAPNQVTGQTARLGPFLESLALALLGIAVAITGWIKTHPRESPAGCCQKCGYELKDLPRCPECGSERLGTLDRGTIVEESARAGDADGGPGDDNELDGAAR